MLSAESDEGEYVGERHDVLEIGISDVSKEAVGRPVKGATLNPSCEKALRSLHEHQAPSRAALLGRLVTISMLAKAGVSLWGNGIEAMKNLD